MSDEREERLLFVVGDELPALKHRIKRAADKQKTSSTELMIRTLCEHFGLPAPLRQHRPAREVVESTSLALSIPTALWQAIHTEAGNKLTSKKGVVLAIFNSKFTAAARTR